MKRLRRIFMNLARVNTPSGCEYRIMPYIIRVLMNNGFRVSFDQNFNIIAHNGWRRGEKWPLLCAHCDTAGYYPKIETLDLTYNARRKTIHVSGDYETLGGDDKSGVAIILRLVEEAKLKGYKFVVLITRGEENQKGARYTNKSIYKMLKYCITIDRRNAADVVYHIQGKDIGEASFIEWVALMAPDEIQNDVNIIKSVYSDARATAEFINSVNISCGYYIPHSKEEYVKLDDMYNSLNWVRRLLEYPYDTFYLPALENIESQEKCEDLDFLNREIVVSNGEDDTQPTKIENGGVQTHLFGKNL